MSTEERSAGIDTYVRKLHVRAWALAAGTLSAIGLFVATNLLVLRGGDDVGQHLGLLSVYFLHTAGELCLSPVGLSAMTTLAPMRVVSLMMGVWFLATAVGNFLGGTAASFYEKIELPTLLGIVAASGIVMGLVMWALVGPIRRMSERAEKEEAGTTTPD